MKELIELLLRITLVGGSLFVLFAMSLIWLIIWGRVLFPPPEDDEISMRILMGFIGSFITVFIIFIGCGLYSFLFNWPNVILIMESGIK